MKGECTAAFKMQIARLRVPALILRQQNEAMTPQAAIKIVAWSLIFPIVSRPIRFTTRADLVTDTWSILTY